MPTLRETGVVQYKLIPGASLKDSKIHLDTKLQVGYPDRISFDWSKVAGDTLAKAENQILKTAVSSAKSFAKDKTVPINYSGDVALFKTSDPRLKSIQVKTLTISPKGNDLAVLFTGTVRL